MKTEILHGFLEANTIQERLDDGEVLEARVRRDPSDPVALVQLENLYRESGNWSDLMTLHLTRAEHADEPETISAALREAAACARILGDPGSAAMILQTAFSRTPLDRSLANELEETALEAGVLEAASDAFTVAAAQASDENLAGELWLRVACCHAILADEIEAVEAALEHTPRSLCERGLNILEESETRVQGRPGALVAFASVCDWVGQGERQVRSLYRAVSAETDSASLALIHCELGRALIDSGDSESAECHLGEALRLCPESNTSRVALAKVCAARGDKLRVTDLLGQADFSEGQTHLAFEAAELYSELDCHTQAAQLYNFTLEVNPGHTGAAIRLLRRYREKASWDEVSALAELVLERLKLHAASEFSRDEILLLLAEALCHLGVLDRARVLLEELVKADQNNVDALRLISEVHHRRGEINLARATQNLVLRYRRRTAPPSAFVEDAFRLALLQREAGDRDSALRLFGEIREAVPAHRPSLMQLAAMRGEAGEYEEAIALLSESVVGSPSAVETARVYATMAQMTDDHLGRAPAAAALYRRALAAHPECRVARDSLVDLLVRESEWRDAVVVMLEGAENASVQTDKFARIEEIRQIIRRELGPRESVSLLNRALDCFCGGDNPPKRCRAAALQLFTDIVTVLYAEEDMEALEKNYRHMIRRLGPKDPLQKQLWQDLGHISRRSSGEAQTTERNVAVIDSQVINLYANAGQDELDKAVKRRLRLIDEQPRGGEHYSALFDLAMRLEHSARAFAAARALVYLGAASDEQRLYYLRHRPGAQIQRSLAPEHFEQVRHPDHDPIISSLLSHIAGPILCARANQPSSFGLNAQGLQGFDLHREVYRRAAALLGVRAPSLYVSATQRGGLAFVATTMGLALITGPDLLPKNPDDTSATRFLCALTLARPSTVLRIALEDPSELEAAFYAAIATARSKVDLPQHLRERANGYKSVLKRNQDGADSARLIHAASQIQPERVLDIHKWWHAVAATSRRIALLVHGNLSASARVLRREPVLAGEPSADQKIHELLVHSVSDAHVEARKSLSTAAPVLPVVPPSPR